MWAAVFLSMPAILANVQQTVPFVASRCTTARPDPVGDPFGTSFFPARLAETTGLIAACRDKLAIAVTGTTTATIATPTNSRARIGTSGWVEFVALPPFEPKGGYVFLKPAGAPPVCFPLIRLSVHPDPEATAQAAAARIATLIAAAQSARGGAHVALAGGNTPRRTYELLALRLVDPAHVDWWFGDERCVPPDDPESNYPLVAETLFAAAAIPASRVHRIRGEDDPTVAAAAYGRELAELVPAGASGFPALDVALLGLGEDGHTASLFPGDPALEVTDALAVPVVAVKPPPQRITLTLPVLRAAREVLILATGAGKKDAVARVLAGPDAATPASLLAEADVTLVIDETAAP